MSSLQKKLDVQVSSYGNYIKEFSANEISTLKNTLFAMNNLGVSEYAERIIDMNGDSVKFCNNPKWSNLEKDNCFFLDTKITPPPRCYKTFYQKVI